MFKKYPHDQARFLEILNVEAMKQGYGQYTTASHTCSFGSVNDAYAFRMVGLFRQSGLNFVSCPTENLFLQGRQDTYPKRRGLTRVKEFVDMISMSHLVKTLLSIYGIRLVQGI